MQPDALPPTGPGFRNRIFEPRGDDDIGNGVFDLRGEGNLGRGSVVVPLDDEKLGSGCSTSTRAALRFQLARPAVICDVDPAADETASVYQITSRLYVVDRQASAIQIILFL